MNGIYAIGDTVFENWKLVRLLGEGSYGKVFEAHRIDFGVTYKSAVKIMTIPQNQSELNSARAELLDDASVVSYFRSIVEDMVKEFELMAKLQGTAHVVGYLDHAVVRHVGTVGWDILIRMELLTPMTKLLEKKALARNEIIKLGTDICRALELCERHRIIHRDIKPANMFVSEFGDYKLGDFGVARTLDRSVGVMSQKGTYSYMAPEVMRNEAYGSNVDLYSLGIVLYSLLNHNRTPFLPPAPGLIRHEDRLQALERRINGAPMPRPDEADDALAAVVLKACAFSPGERYESARQMRRDLEALQPRSREEGGPSQEETDGPVAGGPKTGGGRKKPAEKDDTAGKREEKTGSLAVGIDIRDHAVSVSGFQNGQARLLLKFPIAYERKLDVFLQPEIFNDLVDTLMTRLFELFNTAEVELLFCVPNNFGKDELTQLQDNARLNRLRLGCVIFETDAVAYAARYRDLTGENERFLVGAVIDGLETAASYETRGKRLCCGQACCAEGGKEELPVWSLSDTEKIILVGEPAECRELLGRLCGGTARPTQKVLIRYHNWVTIGMGLLAGEVSGKQKKVIFMTKE